MADTSTPNWKLLYEAGRQALQSRKLQEAEQSFSAALQLAEDFPGGDPRLAATLNALARIYSLQRRYLAAAALLNRLLEVTERTLGPTHVQVAGVLTNLAEMYTHLGAAREELELRERVLAIRADDPDADATSLQRLQERVAELRVTLESQDPPDADEEFEPLPIVRTAEYSAPIATVDERSAPVVERPTAVVTRPATVELPESVSYEPAPVATVRVEIPSPVLSLPPVERITPAMTPMAAVGRIDHGFADMGRDELPSPGRRKASRSSLYTIAAGVVLVAALLAARDWVATPDDERESDGTVNLANVAPAPALPAPAIPAAPEPRTVERLVAERRVEAKRASSDEERSVASESDALERARAAALPRRMPSSAAIERAMRSVDGAVKVIDQRTRAAADSASALRVQEPTFNKVRMSDAVSRPPDR